MKPIRSLAILLFLAFFLSCSSLGGLGPKAKISVVQAEVKKTKKVGKILFADPAGLDGDAAKGFLGAAVATYPPPQGQPSEVSKKAITAIGVPESVGEILLASYQIEFNKLVNKHNKKKKAKAPKGMPLPKLAKRAKAPKNMKQAKALKPKIKRLAQGATELAAALKSGDNQKASEVHDNNKELMGHINGLTNWLVKKNKVTYLLLSHVDGNAASYKEGKPIHMTAALVNVKNGRFRYFAKVKGKKGAIPLPYEAQILAMANSIFSGAEEKAPIPST